MSNTIDELLAEVRDKCEHWKIAGWHEASLRALEMARGPQKEDNPDPRLDVAVANIDKALALSFDAGKQAFAKDAANVQEQQGHSRAFYDGRLQGQREMAALLERIIAGAYNADTEPYLEGCIGLMGAINKEKVAAEARVTQAYLDGRAEGQKSPSLKLMDDARAQSFNEGVLAGWEQAAEAAEAADVAARENNGFVILAGKEQKAASKISNALNRAWSVGTTIISYRQAQEKQEPDPAIWGEARQWRSEACRLREALEMVRDAIQGEQGSWLYGFIDGALMGGVDACQLDAPDAT